jgi:hypothetical protein
MILGPHHTPHRHTHTLLTRESVAISLSRQTRRSQSTNTHAMLAKIRASRSKAVKRAPALKEAPAGVPNESEQTSNDEKIRKMFGIAKQPSSSSSGSASAPTDDHGGSSAAIISDESEADTKLDPPSTQPLAAATSGSDPPSTQPVAAATPEPDPPATQPVAAATPEPDPPATQPVAAAPPGGSNMDHNGEMLGSVIMADIKNAAMLALGPGGSDARLTELIKTALQHQPAAKIEATDADAAALTAKEKAFESAVTAGTFDLRKSLAGQAWSRAIKDPALKAQYSVVGRSYENQRVFRAKWATTELQVIQSQRKHTESITEEDSTSAQHVSIKKLMDDEGDVEAVVNHVFECTSRHASGATFKNIAYLWWNIFTKRYDYLQVKRPPIPHSPLVPIRCNCVVGLFVFSVWCWLLMFVLVPGLWDLFV